MKENKPAMFNVLKFIGFAMIAIGVVLVILGTVVFREDFGESMTTPNLPLMIVGMVLFVFGLPCVFLGFMPQIAKFQINATKYIQSENKDNLSDIASDMADISSDAVQKTAKTVRDTLKDVSYCKECGTKIESDSKFCKNCGAKQ